eukprot:TRINITY_DN49089_c0_g1_i1.p1 TRINITY_DN49089_c0_g1~~TRINITY_DN49089_c0_g1_i1.p1  ORF type:complete len:182 (+),score=37.95 TRINITY_DN49089_c0_g1_i1:93-638(+)
MSQPLSNPENLLGAQIKVVTTFGEELEGELFCVDIQGSNSIVLRQRCENGLVNYKWTKTNIIREVIAISLPPTSGIEELPAVDIRQIEERAQKVEEAAIADGKRWGVGVTEQAQDAFDALSKTMDVEWDGEDILCLGVRISKPYDPNKSITGQNQQAVDRIKKVLQAEMNRMGKKKNAAKS